MLKIVSMIMVVALHATNFGINYMEMDLTSGVFWICQTLRSFSIVAVNCFVLITGYFMSASKVRYKRLIPMWIQVELYSVGIYLVLAALPNVDVTFSMKMLVNVALPVLTNQYWFFTCYFLLVIVAPFLNRFIDTLDQKEYQKALAVLVTVFCLVPSVSIFGDTFGTGGGYSLLWFCILYLTAGYIRKFGVPKKPYALFYAVCSILNVLIVVACGKLLSGVPVVQWVANRLCYPYNSVLVFAAAVFLFLAAVQAKGNFGRISGLVTKIASLSFGVYLLHEHGQFRGILWSKVIHLPDFADNIGLFALYLVGSVLAIFIAGIVVDWIRSILTPRALRRGKNN